LLGDIDVILDYQPGLDQLDFSEIGLLEIAKRVGRGEFSGRGHESAGECVSACNFDPVSG